MRRPLLSITITREGLAFLFMLGVVLAGAILRDINLLILVAGLMIGPLLVNLVAVGVGLRRLTIVRDVPPTVTAGEVVVAEVTLANHRRRASAWMVVVADRVERIDGPARGEQIAASVLFSCVSAGATARATYRGELARRGRYRLGPLRIWTAFPFGLARHTRIIDDQREIIVYPRLGRLRSAARHWTQESLAGISPAQRPGLTEGEFHGLRDWRAGDSRRWIHWRTTARRGELVVRQFEQPRHDDLGILLDLHVPATPSADNLAQVELAIRLAATLAAEFCRRGGGRLYVVSSGQPAIEMEGAASPGMGAEVLAALAVVEPHEDDTLAERARKVLATAAQQTRFVLVSTRAEGQLAAGLREPLGELSRGRAPNLRAIHTGTSEFEEWFDAE